MDIRIRYAPDGFYVVDVAKPNGGFASILAVDSERDARSVCRWLHQTPSLARRMATASNLDSA